jgi:hypothetical protein
MSRCDWAKPRSIVTHSRLYISGMLLAIPTLMSPGLHKLTLLFFFKRGPSLTKEPITFTSEVIGSSRYKLRVTKPRHFSLKSSITCLTTDAAWTSLLLSADRLYHLIDILVTGWLARNQYEYRQTTSRSAVRHYFSDYSLVSVCDSDQATDGQRRVSTSAVWSPA